MLKPSVCDYSDSYILIKRKITITGERADAAARRADERSKGVIFKDCTPLIVKSDINNTKINNDKYIDIAMPMYNLIEYS